uniref:Uncharacterized protein n=1 Tax=Trichuris muris TaxID=70415 RepID=A0A5S6Q7K8_TRIMR
MGPSPWGSVQVAFVNIQSLERSATLLTASSSMVKKSAGQTLSELTVRTKVCHPPGRAKAPTCRLGEWKVPRQRSCNVSAIFETQFLQFCSPRAWGRAAESNEGKERWRTLDINGKEISRGRSVRRFTATFVLIFPNKRTPTFRQSPTSTAVVERGTTRKGGTTWVPPPLY